MMLDVATPDGYTYALDSVGLTVQRDGKFLYIIDATRARHSNTPVVPAR